MRRAWRAVFVLLLLLVPSAAQAEERILRFLSDVQVRKDSSLDVTETITVFAENDRINHGIFRDFPTRYRGPHGSRMRVGFTLEGATLDGMPVPASTQSIANGIRIKLGDPDKIVEVGEHNFVLHYRATREIGRFKDYDELYWNATGNGWIFPIDQVVARIRLPSAVKLGDRAFYTGPEGSSASNAEVMDEKPGEITFRTTQPLGGHEGLTVAVAFPKGVVDEPSKSSETAYLLSDYGPPALGAFSLLGLLGFYFFRLAPGRTRSARRDRRAALLTTRWPDPGGHALRRQDERRRPRLRRGTGRHGRSWPCQNCRGGRRLVLGQNPDHRTNL